MDKQYPEIDLNSVLLGSRILVFSTPGYTVKSNPQLHGGPHRVKGFLASEHSTPFGLLADGTSCGVMM